MQPIKFSEKQNTAQINNGSPEEQKLVTSAMLGQLNKVKKWMNSNRFAPDSGGAQNALVNAALSGQKKICLFLIKKGVSVNSVGYDSNGERKDPLLVAIETGNMELLKIFLCNKARIEQVHMVNAAFLGNIEIMKLLIAAGGKVGGFEKGLTPLAAASMNGHCDMIKFLLQKDVDINERSSFRFLRVVDEQWTPLMHAARYKQSAVISLLIEMGASVNEKSTKQFTALHAAVVSEDEESVRLLLENGAAVNDVDHVGWAPHHLASSCGLTKILNMLRKNGANMDLQVSMGHSLRELSEIKVKLFNSRPHEDVVKLIDLKKCVICNETQFVQCCARCRKVYYCGREHQVSDWKRHKEECEKK